ncbi:DUF2079 domain-containing protein, partial [bacterium]|nr:DUF2079 domain-containing protein [bacterium]
MRSALSRLCAGLAAAAVLLLPLIALQIPQHTPLGLHRFREPSLAAFGLLLLAIAVAPDPRARFAVLRDRGRAVLEHPRFFRAAAAALLVLFALAVVERHLAFRTFSHDFGMLDDAITRLPGHAPLFSPLLGRSFLSEHFSPILFALVPLRALVPSPYVLLLAQAIALWGAAVALRRLLLADGHPLALANLAFVLWLCQPHVTSTLEYVAHME